MIDLILKEDELFIIECLKEKCLTNINDKIELSTCELYFLTNYNFNYLENYLKSYICDSVYLVRDRKNGLYVINKKEGCVYDK